MSIRPEEELYFILFLKSLKNNNDRTSFSQTQNSFNIHLRLISELFHFIHFVLFYSCFVLLLFCLTPVLFDSYVVYVELVNYVFICQRCPFQTYELEH